MKRALNGIADRGVLPRSEIRVSRVLAFVLLALVSSTAGAQCPVCTVPGTAVFPVSPNAGDQQMPAIFGDTVVWEDYRNEATTKGDIYGFDIRKLSEFPVCTAVGQQWMPSMNESRVVWQDGRANPGSITVFDLYSRDLRLGTETPVNSQAANRWNPSVWNGRVVWEELVSGANWDIKSVVMGGGQPETICSAANGQFEASVCGDRVVWQDFRNGTNDDIYSYDLATGVETAVCTAAGDQIFPEIYGTRVVWEDYRSGSKAHIYMKDLSTGVEKKLTSVTSDKWQPVISDRYVVWQDKRNGNWDLYMYDLVANVESPFIVSPYDQQFPRIHGNKVVFQHGNCGALCAVQVYLAVIGAAAYQSVPRVSGVRDLPDGAAVQLTGKIVTRCFGGTFYIEEADRSSGMRVVWPAAVAPGTAVTVKGRAATKDGEREIEAAMVESLGTAGIPDPVHIVARDVAAQAWTGPPELVGRNSGAPNIGLLVTVSGRVDEVGPDYFYLRDGSGDGSGLPLRLKVLCPGLARPGEWQNAVVTGVASLSTVGVQVERAVRVQYQSDIIVY